MSESNEHVAESVPSRTLRGAVERWQDAGLITAGQASGIVAFEEQRGGDADPPGAPATPAGRSLNLGTIISYIGGFLILFALTIFLGANWNGMSRGSQFAWACVAVFGLWSAGAGLRRLPSARTGGNLLIFAGTGAIPLVVYTFQRLVGWWPDSRGNLDYEDFHDWALSVWIAMELISIAVALIVAYVTRFSLPMLLVGFWSWYLAMDLTSLARGDDHNSWNDSHNWVGVLVALVIVGAGFELRRRRLGSYAFWLFLFGHLAWFGHLGDLSFGSVNDDLARVLFLLFALASIVVSVVLQSRLFLVFGGLGLYSWVCYLVFETFEGVSGVTFGLVLVGIFIVLSGIAWQRWIEPGLERRLAGLRQRSAARNASG